MNVRRFYLPSQSAELHYRRQDTTIRLNLRNLTNHETREIMIGLFARLDSADRADHINELLHYGSMLDHPERFPDRHLSQIAQAVSGKERADIGTIDMAKIGTDR